MENELRELLIKAQSKLSKAQQTIEGVKVVFEQRNRELNEMDNPKGLDGLLDKLNLLTRQDELHLLERRMIAEWEKRGVVPSGGHADVGSVSEEAGEGIGEGDTEAERQAPREDGTSGEEVQGVEGQTEGGG